MLISSTDGVINTVMIVFAITLFVRQGGYDTGLSGVAPEAAGLARSAHSAAGSPRTWTMPRAMEVPSEQ